MSNSSVINDALIVNKHYHLYIKDICKDHSLSKTALKILMIINKKDEVTSSDICKQTFLKPNLVSMCIDKLKSLKLVSLLRDSIDKRKIFIRKTSLVSKIVEKVEEDRYQNVSKDLGK